MIKKLFVLLFLFLTISCTYAQKFHGGFFAGLAASQISGDQAAGFNKAGPYAGAFTNYGFTEKSFLQLEIYYILKGSSKNPRPKSNDYTVYKLNLHYIELGLLYKWQFSKRFNLEAGPAFGVLMKNSNIEKDEYGLVTNSQRPPFNKFDFSLTGGLGINIIKHLRANIRYENSVLPVRKPETGTQWRLFRWQYNSNITLSAIYEI
ncbi:MAG TPA: porin family protein [Bacteroidales bacterium]|nr:porin family protein [Bacteroidales bacterium]